jgi:hypothetical protein
VTQNEGVDDMLKVEQTLTCDICGSEIKSDTQIVFPGTQMYNIGRGPTGVTSWHDVCDACLDPLLNAVWALKTAKDAE